jgi:glycerol-3-phosphate acyltransferase PlsY
LAYGVFPILDSLFWILIAFISGAIPWALLVGSLFLKKDIRSIGDGNPGTANAWKLGGHIPGITSLVLEIGKGAIPLYVAFQYLNLPSTITSELLYAVLLLSPIIGHAWSPFLRFRGGKAIAVTGGAWMIAIGWIAVPIAILVLGLGHLTQRNHSITVTATLIGLLLASLALSMHPHIFLFGITNLLILGYKHRTEYSEGVILRRWVHKVRRTVP